LTAGASGHRVRSAVLAFVAEPTVAARIALPVREWGAFMLAAATLVQ